MRTMMVLCSTLYKCLMGTYAKFKMLLLWDDSQSNVDEIIRTCSTPRLFALGSLEEINMLALIAGGMVIIKFRAPKILNGVTYLLGACYCFNAEYPKGPNGHSKNIYLFLEHIPISDLL